MKLFRWVDVMVFITILISPAFGQGGPSILPDEPTQEAARKLNLKSVKAVHLHLYIDGKDRHIVVTRPKTIQTLVEGLKDATETGITNQVSHVYVVDRNGKTPIAANFSLDMPSHALSPKFIAGLREAGITFREWERHERMRKEHEERVRQLRMYGFPLMGVGLLSILFAIKRRVVGNKSLLYD